MAEIEKTAATRHQNSSRSTISRDWSARVDRSVRDAILLGIIFAAIVLILFPARLGEFVCIAGLVIPVTITVTFIVIVDAGETFNLMTLGGLAAAVGLVIDDAIVMVENIVLHRDTGQNRVDAVPQGALREITGPLIGSHGYADRRLRPVGLLLPA